MVGNTIVEREDLPADLKALRWILQMSPERRKSWCAVLAECGEDAQETVMRMIEITEDPASTEAEKHQAAAAIREALQFDRPAGTHPLQGEAAECARDDNAAAQRNSQEAAFSVKLRQLLESKGLTQAELASRIGCSQPAVSQMLNRTRRPQRQTILKLAAALGVHARALWPDLEVADILDTVAEAEREQTMTDAEADAFRRALGKPTAQAPADPLPKRKR